MATQHEVHTHDEHKAAPEGSRIVGIALDGSENADYALDFYLNTLWDPKDYVVIIMVPEMDSVLKHTWDSHLFTFSKDSLAPLLEQQKEDVNNRLARSKEKLLKKKAKGKVRAVYSSTVGDTICRIAEEENVAFIVIGSRGLSVFRRTMTGSVSKYVMEHSHKPTLVVRQHDKSKSKWDI